jgi:3-oxoacyl-(acyl-carrier-protein) synthase
MENTKVFITGLGSLSALGYGAEETWENLKNQKEVSRKDNWDNEKIKPQYFGEAADISFEEEVTWMDRFSPKKYSKLGILACKKALEDAGIKAEPSNDIGLIIETSLGATESVEDYLYDLFLKGIAKVSPIKFTKTVANTVLGDVSRAFSLKGPSSLIFNESSVSYGFDLIKKGVADIVICGGVDHYSSFRILSEQEEGNLALENSDNHKGDSKRSVLGEGAAFIVLESEKSLQQRGKKPYAEILNENYVFDYNNVEATTTRSSFVIDKATEMLENNYQDQTIAFLSGFSNETQHIDNEETFLKTVGAKNDVHALVHKKYTGDMKSASAVMGLSIASQILYNNYIPEKKVSKKIDLAFVSAVHEGGGSSQFLLRQA